MQGDRGSNDAGSVLRAAAPLAFLSAADDQRIDAWPAAFDQHADALRATELVGAERQQVDVRRHLTQVEPAGGLHRVGVHQCAGSESAHEPRHLRDVGDRADLVVDGHHADDGDVDLLVEYGRQFVEIDTAGSIDADDATAEMLDDVEDRVVLDGRADRRAAEPRDRSGDRGVVALGAAPGEHDLIRSAPDGGCHDVA